MSTRTKTERPSDPASLISCERLVVGHAGRALLPSIDIALSAKQLWAVVGRNGAGKSTWLRTVLGLLPPVSGKVKKRAGLRISYVAQGSALEESYPVLVRDVIEMGTLRGWSFLRRAPGAAEAVSKAMEMLDVVELADQPYGSLSEGQKQRVQFARIAASEPHVAILDEPTSALDAVAEQEAFSLLEQLRTERNMTIVVVSHVLGLARHHADHALFLDRRAGVALAGSAKEVFEHRSFLDAYAGVP